MRRVLNSLTLENKRISKVLKKIILKWLNIQLSRDGDLMEPRDRVEHWKCLATLKTLNSQGNGIKYFF